MLVEIVIVTVVLSSMVTGQTGDFDQECSILKTLDNLKVRLQQQEAQLKQQESLLKAQTTQLQQQEARLQQQEALLRNQTTLLQEQETEIAAFKQEQTHETGPVVFMAEHLSLLNPGAYGPLVFTKTLANIGNGYDNNTGIFTAPVAGTYSFNVQFCALNSRYAVPVLFVNNIRKTIMAAYGDPGTTCHSFSYPAILNQGDTVQNKLDPFSDAGHIFYQDGSRINTFSGTQLR